jgi:hypothetical protein
VPAAAAPGSPETLGSRYLRASSAIWVRRDREEKTIRLFTANRAVKAKLHRKGYRPNKASTTGGIQSGWFFTFPLAEFRWTVGRRRPISLSPEHQAARAERLRRGLRASKQPREASDARPL